MAKLGRHKKEILETVDRIEWEKFQSKLKKNVELIGESNLTDKERAFISEFVVSEGDDLYAKTVKALKFKHYILHKDLTQEECTYFVDVDEKGTKPTREHRLTKMSICKIEDKACKKLRAALGSKFNIFSLGDIMEIGKYRTACEPVDLSTKGREP